MSFARARIAAALFFAANGIAFSTWAASIPRVADALALSPGRVAAAVFTLSLGSILTMPYVGRLSDRYGAHRVSTYAGAAIPFVLPLFVEARSFAALLACGFLFGIVLGALDVASNAYAVAAETAENGAWMSQMHGIWSVGNVSGSLIVAALVGARLALPSVGSACVIAVLIAVATRVAIPFAREEETQTPIVHTRVLIVLGILAAFGLLVEGAMGDWGALYLRRDLHASATLAPLGFAAFAGAMMLARFTGDAALLRFGRVRMLTCSAALAALGLATALIVRDPIDASIAYVFVGIGCANLAPAVFGAAGRLAAGKGVGLVITIGVCAFLIGPPAIGAVAQLGDLRHALWIVVVVALVIAIAVPTPFLRRVFARAIT